MLSYKDWPLRAKMVISLSLIICLVLVPLGSASIYLARRFLTEALIGKGQALAHSLAKTSAYGVATGNVLKDLNALTAHISTEPDVIYAAIFDHRGRNLAESGSSPSRTPGAASFSTAKRFYKIQGAFEFFHPIEASKELPSLDAPKEGAIGTACLVLSTASLHHQLVQLVGFTFLALILLLLLGTAFAYRFSYQLTRRLDKILEGYRNMEQGRYDVHVPVLINDEIGELASGLNQMSRKIAEGTLAKEKERAYLDSILQNMADILIVIDSQGKVRTINRVATDLLGYTQEELLGKSSSTLFENISSKEDDVSRIFRGSHLESLVRKGFVRDVELNLVAKDGKAIPILLSGSMLRDEAGKPGGLVIAGKDLTERKRIEMILLQSEKLSAIGQLAAGVAHEINNPLGIILGFAQSAAKRIQASDALSLPIKSIEREALRCKNLVQNLLTFSRRSQSCVQQFDLNETIKNTLDIIEAQARVKSVEIFKELNRTEPLLGDKNQLQQIIINLCNNAIDAMPNGGKIVVRTRNDAIDGRWVVLEVEDNGTGIPQEIQDKIFNPFFTTKEVGKGTGLGLSLVYEIVQKHKARINFKSAAGQGTTFTIRFPVAKDSKIEKSGDGNA